MRILRVVSTTHDVNETTVRLVAALAGADPRTARRFLAGEPVKGRLLREKLAEAARKVAAENAAPQASATP